jgi:hypothetical protein
MFNPDNPICIVQRTDGTFAHAGDVDVLELGNSLPEAVNRLDQTGVVASHWLSNTGGMSVIPSAIVRVHLDDVVKSALPRW